LLHVTDPFCNHSFNIIDDFWCFAGIRHGLRSFDALH
jgi:hypothetical protein